MEMGPSWLATLVVATAVSLVATPIMRRLARSIGLVDQPSDRKVHRDPVPYLGGLAIAVAVLAGLVVAPGLGWRVGAVGLIASFLCVLGLLDDHRQLAPGPRLAVEALAALATLALGFRLPVTGVAVVDAAATLVWIIGLTNAANLLDNMDGLAAGTAASVALGVLLLGTGGGLAPVATLAAAVGGACLGFLAFNKRPATIYMGDAGSLFVGYLLSIMTLAATRPLGSGRGLTVLILLAAVPVADTTTVVFARLRRGKSPAEAGKDHLSHRLVRRGLTPGMAVITLVGAGLLISASAALVASSSLSLWYAVAFGLPVLAALLVVALPSPVYDEPVVGLSPPIRFLAGAITVLAWTAMAGGLRTDDSSMPSLDSPGGSRVAGLTLGAIALTAGLASVVRARRRSVSIGGSMAPLSERTRNAA